MTLNNFESLAGEIFDAVPEKFRLALGDTALVVREEDTEDPELLGCFEGTSLLERSEADIAPLPNLIILYRRAIEEEAAETDNDVVRVARETLIHEIAHALGYDEQEVEEKFESRWG